MSTEVAEPNQTDKSAKNDSKTPDKGKGKRKADPSKDSTEKAKSKSKSAKSSDSSGSSKTSDSKPKSKAKDTKAKSNKNAKPKSTSKPKAKNITTEEALNSTTMRLFNKWFEQETTNGKELSYNMCVSLIGRIRQMMEKTEDASQTRCLNNKINALMKYVNENIENGKMLKKKRVEGTGEMVDKEFKYKDESKGTYTKRVWTGEWVYTKRRRLKPKRNGASKDKKKNVWTLAMERARKQIPELQESPGFVALRKTPPEPLPANPTQEQKDKHWQHKVGHMLYSKTQELKPVLEREQKAEEMANQDTEESESDQAGDDKH